MTKIVSIGFAIFIGSFAMAQVPESGVNPDWFSPEIKYVDENPSQTLSHFYQRKHNGRFNFNAGGDYIGTSLAFMTKGNDQYLYGLNLEILSVSTNTVPPVFNQFQNSAFPDQTTILLPLWFTVKVRLSDATTSRFSPYIIGGVGPTVALTYKNGLDFFNSFSHIDSYLGGGGFVGLGFDYLWAEDWAIFTDVRYNSIRFDRPIGLNENFNGFSLSVGFVRAFGF